MKSFARYKQMGQQPTRDMVSLSRGDVRRMVTEIERLRKLEKCCKQFIKENDVGCPETIYQTDKVSENSLEFIEEVCKIVGYHKV